MLYKQHTKVRYAKLRNVILDIPAVLQSSTSLEQPYSLLPISGGAVSMLLVAPTA